MTNQKSVHPLWCLELSIQVGASIRKDQSNGSTHLSLFTTKSNGIRGGVLGGNFDRDTGSSQNVLDVLALVADDKAMLLTVDIDLDCLASLLLQHDKGAQLGGTGDGTVGWTTDNDLILARGWWWDVNGNNSVLSLEND